MIPFLTGKQTGLPPNRTYATRIDCESQRNRCSESVARRYDLSTLAPVLLSQQKREPLPSYLRLAVRMPIEGPLVSYRAEALRQIELRLSRQANQFRPLIPRAHPK